MSELKYIEAEKLFEKLPVENKVIVVDVREPSDFAEGHIKGAVNHPSGQWNDVSFVDGIVSTLSDAENVVFHCAHSQKRGPTCAQIFLDRLNATKQTPDSVVPAVTVLSNGFHHYEEVFKGNADAIEK